MIMRTKQENSNSSSLFSWVQLARRLPLRSKFLIAMIAYFGYHLLVGERGLVALSQAEHEYSVLSESIEPLERMIAYEIRSSQSMGSVYQRVSYDQLEEMTYLQLGLLHPLDRVVKWE